MNGTGHRIFSQVVFLTAAGFVHVGAPELAFGAIVASATASDDYSPDADQRGMWAKLIPGGHRGPTHTPEIVALALAGVIWLTAARGYPWAGWAVAAGWGSHLLGDWLFGAIPWLILGGRRAGLGLKTGGRVEAALSWVLGVACVPLLWWALGAPGADQIAAFAN
jgi:membrane-bound metal-dependent hydrolase YbcI (DUF457 family)